MASWWGHGSFSDRAMPLLLKGARTAGLRIAATYERVPDPVGVDACRALGLAMGVSPRGGGWEETDATGLSFRTEGDWSGHLPGRFGFPAAGDRRWRPCRLLAREEPHHLETLVQLEDDQGNGLGGAVVRVWQNRQGRDGGSVISVWYRLLEMPQGDALLADLFALVLAN